ncbi:hypothetical protein QYE76_047371 [Lolium multiflorum]|uniref:Uncharacterized protein n=1 Tax=Lolium multiflorum TaxID=4521 RepID=A0AAD8X1W6_LOLMU|nr:hypothetical protein QYE76_047371 [Lolium multiflorum]
MWKTHAFRRALGPLLKQLDVEYDIPAEQQQDGPEPVHDDGSPFTLLPPAPVVLFCKNSPSLKKTSTEEISSEDTQSSRGDFQAPPGRTPCRARLATVGFQEKGYDLSSLLSFDPEFIEPAASKASEESGPSATHGQLQQLKASLSSSIETLVEDTEGIKNILEDIQPHLPVTLQVKLSLLTSQG